MVKIGLDLAFRTCGLAILYEGKLVCDSLIIKKKIPVLSVQYIMVDWVINKISSYIDVDTEIYLEDIFKGTFKTLVKIARTQGAVVDRLRFIQSTINNPEYITAVVARNKVGVNPQCPKVGIQLFVISYFNLPCNLDKKLIDRIQLRVDKYLSIVNSKEKKDKYLRWKLEEELKKYSLLVAKETGINEHIADSAILALAGST